MSRRTMTTVLAPLLVFVAVLAGCAKPGSVTTASGAPATSATPSESVEVTDSNGMRPSAVPTTRVEPPADADRPDGPSPTPDIALTADDLLGLIRTSATGLSTAGSCTPADVRLSLTEPDAAAGHRYAQLTATNIAGRTCELVGWPGIGLRGAWGTPLPVVAEHSTIPVDRVGVPEADSDTAVAVAVGGRAVAEFEWTGALAGTRDEHVSLIAVQLAAGTAPAALLVDSTENIDIGPDTTVRVGPWGPAS